MPDFRDEQKLPSSVGDLEGKRHGRIGGSEDGQDVGTVCLRLSPMACQTLRRQDTGPCKMLTAAF